jgi:hypothetical protein
MYVAGLENAADVGPVGRTGAKAPDGRLLVTERL